jgi:hypothetical protein
MTTSTISEHTLSREEFFAGFACAVSGDPWCDECHQRLREQADKVYVTEGFSAAYHASDRCPLLVAGQAHVAERGGAPAPIKLVTIDEARQSLHFPCQQCFR